MYTGVIIIFLLKNIFEHLPTITGFQIFICIAYQISKYNKANCNVIFTKQIMQRVKVFLKKNKQNSFM
jgi:hypothetical protein